MKLDIGITCQFHRLGEMKMNRVKELEKWEKEECKKALQYDKYVFVWGCSGNEED